MAADFYTTGQPPGNAEEIAVQSNRFGRARFQPACADEIGKFTSQANRRLLQKIPVFVILLFIDYSPLRCQKNKIHRNP